MNTVNPVIDNISINQLQERYGLSTRQSVYNRLDKLGIKPDRGKINAEQLAAMDQLHVELQNPQKDLSIAPLSTPSNGQMKKSNGQLDNQIVFPPEMFMALLGAINPQPAKPSAIALLNERLEFLEACEKRGNTLATSELAPLLGLSSKALGEKKEHHQYGYRFLRSGKHSHELAWSITKLST